MIILKISRRIRRRTFSLFFELKDCKGSGFSFPCDKRGNPRILSGRMRTSLEHCKNNIKAFKDPVVLINDHSYLEPAELQCVCGKVVILADPLTNECECGLLYNSIGQRLAPRSQWDWGVEED